MKQYICWITAMLPEYYTQISSELIKQGFSVSAGGSNGPIIGTGTNVPAVVISLIVQKLREPSDISESDLINLIRDICSNMKVYSIIVSIIVSGINSPIWLSSNFAINSSPRIKKPNPANLILVKPPTEEV